MSEEHISACVPKRWTLQKGWPALSVHARTQQETFVPAGCFSGMFLPGSAGPSTPREGRGGDGVTPTGPESSTWSRLLSEVPLGNAFYFLSPALIAGTCLAERCLPGIIPSVFQVLI